MRSFSTRIAIALLAFSAASTLPIAAQSAKAVHASTRVLAPVDTQQTAPVAGHLPVWASASNEFGPVDPGLQIDSAIVVLARAPQVQAAFDQLLIDQQTPGSPRYHQWITPEQAGAIYGVSQSDVDAVTSWLSSQGLRVDSVGPDKIFVTFSGPASAIARALSTEFRSYNRVGKPLYSINSEPKVPAALAPVVKSFVGLSELYFQTNHITSDLHTRPTSNGLSPQLTSTTSGNHYMTPADFNLIFNVKAAATAGFTGTGVKVVYLAGARVAPADVTNYQTATGLPSSTPNYIVPTSVGATDPGAPKNTFSSANTDDGNQDESTLDFNRINGTAPGATIDVLLDGLFLNYSHLLALVNYNTNTLKDPIMSISVGGCENNSPAQASNFDSAFSLAAAGGITTFISSGDSAAAGCEGAFAAPTHTTQVLSPNVLCSTGSVTCVGGTEFADFASPGTYWSPTNGAGLLSALSYIPEGGWNEPSTVRSGVTTYVVAGSGGGVSSIIAKPAFQAGVGVPADSFRDTPDVSFPAASHAGYYACLTYLGGDCVSGSFFDFSGTSASAPSMAGVMALVVQQKGVKQGNFNPTLYTLAATTSNGVFHDTTPATSGVSNCVITTPSMCNNSTVGETGGVGTLSGGLSGYALTTGYDQVTGLGSMDVGKLITALSLTPTTTAVQPSTGTVTFPVQFTSFVSASSGHATGTVQLQSNGVNLGSPVALVTSSTPGLATASTQQTFNTAGTYAITAIYSGDSNFAASTSPVDNLVISKVGNSVTLAVSPTSISTSQTTTLTATIAQTFAAIAPGPHPQALSPTGTVQFYAGTNTVGSPVAVSNGQAVLVTPTFAVGSYSMTAVYSGDTTFAAGTSNAVTLTVNNGTATTTTITGSASTLTTQQSATFTATVGTPSGTPTGTIQFLVDGVAKGAPVATVARVATSPAITFTAGTHTVTATYSGDATFAGSSTTTGASVTVTAISSTTAATLASANITTQQSDLLTATVTGTGGTATGTVQFQLDGANVGAAATLTAGVATYTLPAGQTAGTHTVSAVYSGDATFATSTSAGSTLTVTKVVTTTSVAAASSAITTLQSDVITATVAGSGATGTVTFKDGAATLGSPVTLTAGTAAYTAAAGSLAVGSHTITAVYSGDAAFAASTSAVGTIVTVALAPTTTTLAVASASITTLQSDLFTATVTGTGATGTVTFRDGTTVLGSPVAVAAGVATYTAAAGSLAIGAHSITATYSGDATFATSASAATTVTVITAPVFSLAVNPTSVTFTAGAASANSVTLTATAVSGTPNPIALTCSIVYNSGNAPIPPTCPTLPSLSPTPGTPATLTVTLNTVAPHSVTGSITAHLRSVATTTLCTLFLFGLPLAVRRRRNWRSLVALLVMVAGFAAISGCSKGTPALSGGTTTGSYTVTITGTSTGAATQTTTFTATIN